MIFEIINNTVENLLIAIFIIKYINLQKNKLQFMLVSVIINTIISTILTYFNIIGIAQTLLIQITIILCLYKYDAKFSFQNIAVSLYCNILLFLSVYFSILILSVIFRVIPYHIQYIDNFYIYHVLLSRILFILFLVISLYTRPLLISEIEIKESKFLLLFEIIITIILPIYFTTIILSNNFSYIYCLLFFCFIFLFFLFCYIFNKIITVNLKEYNRKLSEKINIYKEDNLKNIKSIKMHIDYTEHRINYILQLIEYDLENKRYDDAIEKLKLCKKMMYNISSIICTNNEIFDFIINLELQNYIHEKKKIKICSFISKNSAYDNIEIISPIVSILKTIYQFSDKLEIYLLEKNNRILELRFIVYKLKRENDEKLINEIKNIKERNITINNINSLIILRYEEKLYEYL